MSSTTTKVLTGCGIGCLVMIAVAAGVSFMGYRWVRDTTAAVEEAGRIENELEARYGSVRAFVPPAIPGVPADRVEAFLAVREAMTVPRDELSSAVAGLAGAAEGGGVASGFRAARAGVGLAPLTFEFVNARNQALLDADMGVGEYTWIYWMTYVAWLGHPADESDFHENMQERDSEHGSVRIHMDGGMEPERLTWRLRRDITAMLRHLEEALADEPERADLLEAVAGELVLLDEDSARVPWQDGLPEAFAVGLGPYRQRLEATYSSATNPFELIEFD